MRIPSGREHAPDLAHHLHRIPHVLQHRIALHSLKNRITERQALRVGGDIHSRYADQIQVHVTLHGPARTADVKVPTP
jgi:malonyl CoA-acyl carrier protein transacylase